MDSLFDNPSVRSLGEAVARVPDALAAIPGILRDPSADPVRASIVLGVALALALIILVTIALFLLQPRSTFFLPSPGADSEVAAHTRAPRRQRRSARDWATSAITAGSSVVVGAVILWMAVGATTARSDACSQCHTTSVHSVFAATDAHVTVACIECHEPGGPLARVTSNLPSRVEHYFLGSLRPAEAKRYGTTISSIGCRDCHLADLTKTVVDQKRGLRVSHKEPLAAGAECVDCHQPQDGQVLARTVGMGACVRCHDGRVAKAGCPECHVGDPARAIVTKSSATSLASRLVTDSRCGSCHLDQRRCDNCHGVRMPHTDLFKAYAHANAGAVSIWESGGRVCGKCHSRQHRACTRDGCHTYKFPQHGLTWRDGHQQAAWSQADGTCRCHNWSSRQHDGMNLCQVCHETKPRGARP